MKKYIDWINCKVCESKEPIEITTDKDDDSQWRLYEGDIAKCESCGATGTVFVVDCCYEPIAEVHWDNRSKINKLIDLCIKSSGHNPSDTVYDIEVHLSSDSIIVRKVVDHEQVDIAVSSTSDTGVDYLMSWVCSQNEKGN